MRIIRKNLEAKAARIQLAKLVKVVRQMRGGDPGDPESLRNADLTNREALERRRISSRRGVAYRHAMTIAKQYPEQRTAPLHHVVRLPWAEVRREAMAQGAIVGTRDPEMIREMLTYGALLEKKDVPFVHEVHLLAAVRYLMEREGLDVPFAEHRMSGKAALEKMSKADARAIFSAQGDFFRSLLNKVELEVEDHRVRIFEVDGDRRLDITDRVDTERAITDPSLDYSPLRGAVATRLDRWTRLPGHESVVTGVFTPGNFKGAGKPILQLLGANEAPPSYVPGTVAVVRGGSTLAIRDAFRALAREAEVRQTRAFLESAMAEGAVAVHDGFDLHHAWPRHALMDDLRAKILPLMEEKLKQQDFVVDPQDLEHQILFRLTTISPRQIYEGGDAVVRHLQQVGAFDHWQNISKIDPKVLEQRPLKRALIEQVIDEQFAIIKDRMIRSGIDLGAILSTTVEDPATGKQVPFFNSERERRWELKWQSDGKGPKQLFAVSPEGVTKRVDFRLVDRETAEQITFNLHYIHTLRADGLTFGMYLEGMELPFAVETTEFTDRARPYKQNAYLINGYHPHHGIELTRLYTFPGGPLNIIGVIDGAVAKYVKANHPAIEFVSTTVMPTYAKTKSTTIAGGIDRPCLIKKGEHKFAPVEIDGRVCYEHLTNRRAGDADERQVIHNHPEFPLLPVLEVIQQFGSQPSFKPIPGIEGKMIAKGYE